MEHSYEAASLMGGMPRLLNRLRANRVVLIAAACVVLLLVPVVVLAMKWPFTREKTVNSLEHFTSSYVHVEKLRLVFIPHPGYVARHVSFSRPSRQGNVELAAIDEIDCEGSWVAIISLTHHAKKLEIRGLHVTIPASIPPSVKLHPELKEKFTLTTLVANGTVLDVRSRGGDGGSLRFAFPELTIEDIGNRRPMRLFTVMRNPKPAGDLTVHATIGPILFSNVEQMQLAGSFDFTHADLSQLRAVKGVLESHGRFEGTLKRCKVEGRARVPDFEVAGSGHPVDMMADFATAVDGRRGEVVIDSIAARFLNTRLAGSGAVEGAAGIPGRTTRLELHTDQARVEDLLHLFVKADPSSVEGPITFKAHVELPPGKQQFLRKVRLDGEFGLTRAESTKQETQAKIDELSNRARGVRRRKELQLHRVPSDVKASVQLRNAVANFSNLYFGTPGAEAEATGTYDLISQRIDLHGRLAMHATLSQAVSGIKSILLRPLNPFFKKDTKTGAIVPVQVTGYYSHPVFRVSLKAK